MHLLPYLEIDAAVSPKLLLVKEVLKALRKSEYKIVSAKGSESQILEFNVVASSKAAGKTLEDLKFPPNSICVSVFRGDEIIIPDGSTRLMDGDRAVVFTLKSSIESLENLFHE